MTQKPWGPVDPNSQHQLWSRWTFTVESESLRKHPPQRLLHIAFAKWCGQVFGSVHAKTNCDEWVHTHKPSGRRVKAGYILWVEAEGPPATDPSYSLYVRRLFRAFTDANWSRSCRFKVETAILAGDAEDGKPPRQLVVLPFIAHGMSGEL